ncbi:MAG: hypothetical protein RLZ25_839 [Pseudomonadota bacterium]|jgi:hypothetical protein
MEIFILGAVIVAAVATVDVKNSTKPAKGPND